MFYSRSKRKDTTSQSREDCLTIERLGTGIGKLSEALQLHERGEVLPEYFFEKVSVAFGVPCLESL